MVHHPHFEREDELATPIIDVLRDLGEGKTSSEFAKALEIAESSRVYEIHLRSGAAGRDRTCYSYAKTVQESSASANRGMMTDIACSRPVRYEF